MKKSRQTGHLVTEKINENTKNIDRLSIKETIDLICNEDRSVIEAVSGARKEITAATEVLINTLRNGGRIFFIGAGTSGRLGVIEAAECPPTFGTSPELFQAIIAGGREAVWDSVEGAEDSGNESRSELEKSGLGPIDTVVGIAASSSTPFVTAALEFGKSKGCCTVLITCNPVEKTISDVTVSLLVGPEVIVGSTRMKSGTATKMVLNMMTTTAMVQMGKTYGNLMVDLKPASEKLRSRAVRIVSNVCEVTDKEAYELLDNAQWSVKTAIVMKKKNTGLKEAIEILDRYNGFLYKALAD